MAHYDDVRVADWARQQSKKVTEQDKKILLKAMLENNGVMTMFTESPDWPWPIVRRMLEDGDKRITFDINGGGYKLAKVEINELSEKERTKILLS